MSALRSADMSILGTSILGMSVLDMAARSTRGRLAPSAPEGVERGGVEGDGGDLREEAVADDAEERLVDVDRPAVALAARAVDRDRPLVVSDDVLQRRAVRAVRQHAGVAQE